MRNAIALLGFLALVTGTRPVAAEAAPDLQQLWQLVQQQQATIDQLSHKLDRALARLDDTQTKLSGTEQALAANTQKIEATADAVEAGIAKPKAVAATWAERTSLGGYGELAYNNLHDSAIADGQRDNVDRTDFKRFVLYFNHEFNDWLRFGSELEVEHVVVSSDPKDPGEVALEQAWLEMDMKGSHRLRVGLDLLPLGILNQTHEPNTFYGVERNPVETEIIPSTWWEAGTAVRGDLASGLGYDLVLHTGMVMPVVGDDAFRPRKGRTEIAAADNQDVALSARLRYTAIPGLELAVAGQYQADYTGIHDRDLPGAAAAAYLLETHLDYRHSSGLGLRGLYAHWHFGADRAHGLDPGARNADNQDGWYLEPAYRFDLRGLLPGEAGVFARYSRWDQVDGLGLRFRQFERVNLGMNYWPAPQVVFKIDGQWENANGVVRSELDGFNLGVGYQF